MIKRICLLPLVLCLSSIGFAQSDEVRPLTPGQSVERDVVGGEAHQYRLTLTAGQFVRVMVDQKGIDASLTLTAPDGEQVAVLNLMRPGGIESLAAEAKSEWWLPACSTCRRRSHFDRRISAPSRDPRTDCRGSEAHRGPGAGAEAQSS